MSLVVCFINTYNYLFENLIINECICYNQYKNVVNSFLPINVKHYRACVLDEKTNKVYHNILPIMLGSHIDFNIRGLENLKATYQLWGSFFLDKQVSLFSTYSTYDALTLYVSKKKNTIPQIRYFNYINKLGFELNYTKTDGVSTIYNSIRTKHTDDSWVDIINSLSPFNEVIYANEYLDLYNMLLDQPHNPNDLKHRLFLTAPHMMYKKLLDIFKEKTLPIEKARSFFIKGSFLNSYKKNNVCDNIDFSLNKAFINHQTEGKLTKIHYNIGKIARNVNDGVRNLSVLEYPTDAKHFISTLNTKDMKDAGESLYVTDLIAFTIDTNNIDVFNYLSTFENSPTGVIVVLDNFLIHKKIDWPFQSLLNLKSKFPQVTTKYYDGYLFINCKNSVIVKYSHKYNCFFSPNEVCYWSIDFSEMSSFSPILQEFPNSVLRILPSKITVSIHNLNGSISNEDSLILKSQLQNIKGFYCYMKYFDTLTVQREIGNTDNFDIHSKFIKDIVTQSSKLEFPSQIEYLHYLKNTFKNNYNTDYIDSIHTYKKPKSLWNMKLYAMFADVGGSTIEDGVVLNSKTCDLLPPITFINNYNFELTSNKRKNIQKSQLSIQFLDIPELMDSEDPFVGTISYNEPLNSQINNNIYMKIIKLGETYRHDIYFKLKKYNTENKYSIKADVHQKNITIIINTKQLVPIYIGSKIANAFGQKNIISDVKDLSGLVGYTKTGLRVEPDLLYAPISVISRQSSAQIIEMLNHPNVAFTKDGAFMAPIDLVVSSLIPESNMKPFKIKIDTLMTYNGFIGKSLKWLRHHFTVNKFNETMEVVNYFGLNLSFISPKEELYTL